MRDPSVITVPAILGALLWVTAPGAAQDFDGKKVAVALTQKNIPPVQRLPDGHPDLGNDKGSWEPPGVGDMAGTGGGFAGTAQPDKKIDVPFLPWAKTIYDCLLYTSDAADDLL